MASGYSAYVVLGSFTTRATKVLKILGGLVKRTLVGVEVKFTNSTVCTTMSCMMTLYRSISGNVILNATVSDECCNGVQGCCARCVCARTHSRIGGYNRYMYDVSISISAAQVTSRSLYASTNLSMSHDIV